MLAPGGGDAAVRRSSIDGDVVFSCLKGAEDGDGLILRCFNPGDTRADVAVTGNINLTAVRLDETPAADDDDGTLELGPGQIGTFRLTAGEAAT